MKVVSHAGVGAGYITSRVVTREPTGVHAVWIPGYVDVRMDCYRCSARLDARDPAWRQLDRTRPNFVCETCMRDLLATR